MAGEKKTERGAEQEVGRLKVWLGVEGGGLGGFAERREGKITIGKPTISIFVVVSIIVQGEME